MKPLSQKCDLLPYFDDGCNLLSHHRALQSEPPHLQKGATESLKTCQTHIKTHHRAV